MPILLAPIPDPPPPLIAGEQMRAGVYDRELPSIGSIMRASVPELSTVVCDEDAFLPMNSFIEGSSLATRRSKNGELLVRDGGGIMTSMGAWVFNDWLPLLNYLGFASPRWQLVGVTRDNAGAPLGNCRVIAFDYGLLAGGASQAYAGETISDGSGNYTLEVGTNKQYQVVCYLAGSPNLAGVTDIITPTQA